MPNSPTIVAVETDAAWVVILAVSLVTFAAAFLLRRLIHRPGGIASSLLLLLPLLLPLVAALAFDQALLPEIGVLKPAGQALREGSGELLHLLLLADQKTRTFVPYALAGSAGRWVLLFGLSFSSFMLIRRGLGAWMVHRLIKRCASATHESHPRVVHVVADLSARAGLETPPPILLLPPGVSGAFAVGARRGRILLSEDLVDRLEPDELEAILAHEIAHLDAQDCRVLFLAGILRDVVAWNPVAHFALRGLTTERELEADERAAALTRNPLAVASGLLKVYEIVRTSRLRHHTAIAFLKPGGRVKRRVGSLLALADGRPSVASPGRLPYVFAAVVVALLGLQVAAHLARHESGAFAIMLGDPTATSTETWIPRRFAALQAGTRQRGDIEARRAGRAKRAARTYLRPASTQAVRAQDLRRWIHAMNVWTRRQDKDFIKLWRGRVDWKAVPVFSEPVVGPAGLYRIKLQRL